MEYYSYNAFHGAPYMECYAWSAIHGVPYMDYYTWSAIHGLLHMECYTWSAMHGVLTLDVIHMGVMSTLTELHGHTWARVVNTKNEISCAENLQNEILLVVVKFLHLKYCEFYDMIFCVHFLYIFSILKILQQIFNRT